MPDYTCSECHEPIEGVPDYDVDVANTPHIARDWLTEGSPYNRLCIDCRLKLHPLPEDKDSFY